MIDNLRAVRDDYERRWVRFNIGRTIAATGALGCLVRALMVRNRRTS